MPDDSDGDHDHLPPAPSEGSKTYRTRVGEVIGQSTAAVSTISRFTPQQAIVVLCVCLMGFVCVSQAFQQYSDREERKSAAKERAEATATAIRENNAQAELTRQHCAGESTALRAYFAEQTDKRMRFESEERAKDRAALNALLQSFEDLRKVLLRKIDGPNGP